jgi:hypothetical protein
VAAKVFENLLQLLAELGKHWWIDRSAAMLNIMRLRRR